MFQAEPSARAAEAGDHFIADQKHVILAANFANAREVIILRSNHATRALDRLGDKRGDRIRAFTENRFFKEIRGGDTRTGVFIPALEPVGIG